MLLRSACVKAVHRTLMKLSPKVFATADSDDSKLFSSPKFSKYQLHFSGPLGPIFSKAHLSRASSNSSAN